MAHASIYAARQRVVCVLEALLLHAHRILHWGLVLGLGSSALLSAQTAVPAGPPAGKGLSPRAVQGAAAQTVAPQEPLASLEDSESLFTLLAALNSCGYDDGLAESAPVRVKVRADVAAAAESSDAAREAHEQVCSFYRDHRTNDTAHDLSKYISLALFLKPAPDFTTTLRESDLPPDASSVLGVLPRLQRFYDVAGLHQVWLKHQAAYDGLIGLLHNPVSALFVRTDLYLKMPSTSYNGRHFTAIVEPLAAPGQVNARNYGEDYYIVVSPSRDALRLEDVQHTYLHYMLDPMLSHRSQSIQRLDPLLASLDNAPLAPEYKANTNTFMTECLIRAIEARNYVPRELAGPVPNDGTNKERGRAQAARRDQLEAARRGLVDSDVKQGFVLTSYFYDRLPAFEKSPESLHEALPDLLFQIDVDRERKRAGQIEFARQATPEVIDKTAPKPQDAVALDEAEQSLEAGNPARAAELAQKSLTDGGDAGRASFILARADSLRGDMQGARESFQRTLQASHDPRTLAWSHIYLGRICDLEEQREQAIQHYTAAQNAGDSSADTLAAARRGIDKPYAPNRQAQPDGQADRTQEQGQAPRP